MVVDRFYSKKDAAYFRHAREDILDLLPAGGFGTVVDVGGSSGATLSAIKARWPNVRTICIDIHEESARTARERGHEAFVCDIERSIPDVFGSSDLVLFLDILEHLVDPWRRLTEIVKQLPPGARVIVSLPNVRFWEASCRLFFLADWRLRDAGVMDRTHLRFFTRRTGAEMLRAANLHIYKIRAGFPGKRRYPIIDLLSLGLIRDFLAAQYVYAAEKTKGPVSS
jgi:SAM-dependent methyltransferase